MNTLNEERLLGVWLCIPSLDCVKRGGELTDLLLHHAEVVKLLARGRGHQNHADDYDQQRQYCAQALPLEKGSLYLSRYIETTTISQILNQTVRF